VATCAGTVIALLLLTVASRRTAYAWLLVAVVASSAGFTAWLGHNDAVRTRLATLFAPGGVSHESRLEHWKTALQAVPDFWFLGSGLGTYRYAYTRYQT